MWNLKNNTNESIQKTETNSRHRKEIYGYQRGEGGKQEQIISNGLTDTNYYT